MKKKIICLFAVMCMLASFAPALINGAEGAEDIEIGDYIQMGKYYGQPILWRCVASDSNGLLILSDKIICLKAYDAKTSANSATGSHSRITQYSRQYYGSDYWKDSNMRSWLNSTAKAGKVEWLCGNPPVQSYVYDYYNDYADEAGFLTNFTEDELNAMKVVMQKAVVSYVEINNYVYDTGSEKHAYRDGIGNVEANFDIAYGEMVTDKMFPLDVKQLTAVYKNRAILGDYYYIGYPTEQAVKYSEYKNDDLAAGSRWNYWLRVPNAENTTSINVRSVNKDGQVFYDYAYDSSVGVRPAFYLDTDAFNIKSGNGTASKPYSLYEEVIPTPTATPTLTPTASPTATPTSAPTAKPTEAPATGYPYEITAISLKSNAGEDLAAIPENTGFVAAISIEKKKTRENKDYVVVAMYGEGNTLIGVNYIYAKFAEHYDYEFGINIPKQSEKIKSIKAYIWDSFDNMQPLCDSRSYE